MDNRQFEVDNRRLKNKTTARLALRQGCCGARLRNGQRIHQGHAGRVSQDRAVADSRSRSHPTGPDRRTQIAHDPGGGGDVRPASGIRRTTVRTRAANGPSLGNALPSSNRQAGPVRDPSGVQDQVTKASFHSWAVANRAKTLAAAHLFPFCALCRVAVGFGGRVSTAATRVFDW